MELRPDGEHAPESNRRLARSHCDVEWRAGKGGGRGERPDRPREASEADGTVFSPLPEAFA